MLKLIAILKGRRNYDLMLNLQPGLRSLSGRVTPKSTGDIDVANFSSKAWVRMQFPSEGVKYQSMLRGRWLLTRWSAPPWRFLTWLNNLSWIGLNLAFLLGTDSLSFWCNDKWFQWLVSNPWVMSLSLPLVDPKGRVSAKREIVVDSLVSTFLKICDMA